MHRTEAILKIEELVGIDLRPLADRYGVTVWKIGVLVQPCTKGAGHGSTSRAFYARKNFVAHILKINLLPFVPPAITEK